MDESATRITSGKLQEDELVLDTTLRPRRLEEFVGQEKIKDNLAIAVAAAQQRGEPLDHHLLYGPPGLGKTTLAYIIAHEMSVSIRSTLWSTSSRPSSSTSRRTSASRATSGVMTPSARTWA